MDDVVMTGWSFIPGDCRLPYGNRRLIEKGETYRCKDPIWDDDVLWVCHDPLDAMIFSTDAGYDAFTCVVTENSGDKLRVGPRYWWSIQRVRHLFYAHSVVLKFWAWRQESIGRNKNTAGFAYEAKAKFASLLRLHIESEEMIGADDEPAPDEELESCDDL